MSDGHEDLPDLGTVRAHPVEELFEADPPFEDRKLSDLVGGVTEGASTMAREIVDVHRNPKPNSRPIPDWVRGLTWLMDESIPVAPGRRVGADGVVSFIPGIGDAAGLVASMVVVLAGVAAGVSLPTLTLMMVHVGIDTIVGAVPFLGAVFDLGYKANTRNLRLIERDLADRAGARRSAIKVFALSAAAITCAVLLFLIALIGGTYLFVRLVAGLF
ncbi:MAG: DUF4112 domain-containing protein [Microthrixaceae bacterium]